MPTIVAFWGGGPLSWIAFQSPIQFQHAQCACILALHSPPLPVLQLSLTQLSPWAPVLRRLTRVSVLCAWRLAQQRSNRCGERAAGHTDSAAHLCMTWLQWSGSRKAETPKDKRQNAKRQETTGKGQKTRQKAKDKKQTAKDKRQDAKDKAKGKRREKRQEAKGKRQEAKGKRQEAKGKIHTAKDNRQEAKGKRQKTNGKRQKTRDKRQRASAKDPGKDKKCMAWGIVRC